MSKTSSSSNTSQDFLTLLQQAESEVETRVEKAKKKAHSALQTYLKKAETQMTSTLEAARSKAKDKVKSRQVAAREGYEAQVAEGKKESQRLEKEVEPKIAKQLPMAQSFFINEILG